MILKHLYLQVEDFDISSIVSYSFYKSSRFICNYLERECLSQLKFDGGKFDRIVINVINSSNNPPGINSANALCIGIGRKLSAVFKLPSPALLDFQIEIIRFALKRIADFFDIPLTQLFSTLDKFVQDGFHNEWEHANEVFPVEQLQVSLLCKLTQAEFLLRLVVLRESKTFYNRIILKTDPDEIAFEPRFDAIELKADSLIVTSKIGKPLKTLNLS